MTEHLEDLALVSIKVGRSGYPGGHHGSYSNSPPQPEHFTNVLTEEVTLWIGANRKDSPERRLLVLVDIDAVVFVEARLQRRRRRRWQRHRAWGKVSYSVQIKE